MIKLVKDTIDKNDINKLIEWLNQDEIPRLTKGDLTWELESKWAKKIGTKYSVYVNSGSSAIILALASLLHTGKLKNNKVVVPGLSWATDVSSPMLLGMEPILCDSNLEDLSCDLEHLEELFKTNDPSCMILVSPLGLVPNMEKVISLCEKYNVSMYFGHHLSTIEGGFINTNDEDFYYSLLMMRSHGWDRDLPTHIQEKLRKENNVNEFDSLYTFYLPGFNLRATDLQAFIGLMAIDKLDGYSEKRNENFKKYKSLIGDNKIMVGENKGDFVSNFAYPIINERRNEIVNKLLEKNIEVRPLIAGDMSKKPMWVKKYGPVELKNCELINKFGFYIPNHQGLTFDEIQTIVSIINE